MTEIVHFFGHLKRKQYEKKWQVLHSYRVKIKRWRRASYNVHYIQPHLHNQNNNKWTRNTNEIISLKKDMIIHILLSVLCTQIWLYRFSPVFAFRYLKNNTECTPCIFLKHFTVNNNLSAKWEEIHQNFKVKPYALPNSIENDAHGKFHLSLETYFCPWIPEAN